MISSFQHLGSVVGESVSIGCFLFMPVHRKWILFFIDNLRKAIEQKDYRLMYQMRIRKTGLILRST